MGGKAVSMIGKEAENYNMNVWRKE